MFVGPQYALGSCQKSGALTFEMPRRFFRKTCARQVLKGRFP